MEFDWQGMLDFVVSCEKEEPYLKEETPFFGEDPIECCPEDSYNVAVLSQLPRTTDGAIHLVPEVYDYPTTILPFNSYSPEAEPQNNYTSFEDSLYHQQSNYVQEYNVPPHDAFYSHQGYYDHEHSSQQYVYPEQQSIPEPETANTQATFPIRIEIMGYVNQDASQETQQPTTKSTTKTRTRNPYKTKKLKTFISDWNCTKCDRAFKSKGGLSQHNQQIHSGPMPHTCDVCGKRFREFKTMQGHRQRHLAQDKPFKCNDCPKQFFRASDLQRHDDLHHGMKRFSCSVCGKAFDRADHVKDHELSHENGTVKNTRVQKRK